MVALRSGTLLWLALAATAAPVARAQETPAGEKPLTAAVLEYADKWTEGATGAARLAKAAGFEVRPLDLTQSPDDQPSDVIIFGSFVSENKAYVDYVKQQRPALLKYVERGGVIVQFTQADQTESSSPFAPENSVARRNDDDFATVFVFAKDHPLFSALSLGATSPGVLTLPKHFGRGASWESLSDVKGGRVLAAASPTQGFAVLEFSHGKGRVVATSLFIDKQDDKTGKLKAPPEVQAAGAQFFAGLKSYVAAVKSGQAPAVAAGDKNQLKAAEASYKDLPELLKKFPVATASNDDPDVFKAGELPPIKPGSFSLAVMPDTQIYAEKYPEHFKHQTRWIGENVAKRNIQYTLQLGDITNRNTHPQWEVARDSMYLLDGKVPYVLAPGNHDYGEGGSSAKRETYFNQYFPYEKYHAWKSFGGVFEEGRLENCWQQFQVGSQKFMILCLEWGPRDAAVEWANKVVAEHPEHRVILITHAYMYFDETRYDWKAKGAAQSWNPHAYGTGKDEAGTNDGEELWQKLVKRHKNFIMTLNGHVLNDGLGYLASTGEHGNVVHQMLVNYQMKREGGEGFLRMLEFDADGETVRVKAFSPSTVQMKVDPQNDFEFKLSPPLKLGEAKR